MTRIHFETDADVRMEVWGIVDADLPDTAETLDAAFDGGPWQSSFGNRDPGMCLVSIENVAQETMPYPVLESPPESGQLNGDAGTLNDSTLSITTMENNSLVLSAFGTGSNGATGVTSSLSTTLWDLDNGDGAAPDSANFNGSSEVIPTAGLFSVLEDTPGDTVRAAHIVLALAPIVEGEPYASDYVPVTLFQTFAGNLNYRAVGNSFRTQSNNGDFCAMAGSASQTLPLPAGTTQIRAAYLYWSGSGGSASIDDTVTFGPTGSEVSIVADDIFQIVDIIDPGLDFFLGYKEVSGLITTATSQEYTMSDLAVETGTPYSLNQTCLAGWGLVVVYENVMENPFVNVINLFHGFQPFQNSSFTLVPRNFRMATPDLFTNVPRGQITHITFEGDDTLNTGDEVFDLQNDPNALTFEAMQNPFNVGAAQYNDTISLPVYDGAYNFTGYQALSTTSYGADVDTYYIAGPEDLGLDETDAPDNQLDILYPFGNAESEQITTRYAAGQDLVLLAGEFISVTNAPLADLEVFVNAAGTFRVESTGNASFVYEVVNNGNSAASNGFADGEIILTGNMPPGITINTINADPQWVCSTTASAFTCTFDIAGWTGGTTANQLDDGESLPVLEAVVDVGDETFFTLPDNDITTVARLAHTGGNCPSEPVGVQPDPTLCDKSPQFDNVNDLNKNQIDINDLFEKQPANNNVDRVITNVRGIETDLAMNKSVVGVIESNEPAQYELVVTNFGPDDTSKTITVTDTLPDGLTPVSAIGTGWSCGISGQDMSCTRPTALAEGASTTINVVADNTSDIWLGGFAFHETAVPEPASVALVGLGGMLL
ncbi:MAG: hypothetical protein WED11_09245, partial [Natronospirillum sp.]